MTGLRIDEDALEESRAHLLMADSTALYMVWKTGSRFSGMLPLTYSATLSCSTGIERSVE